MDEQTYERFVGALESKYDNALLHTAIDSLQSLPEDWTVEEKIDETRARIEVNLFHSTDWEKVEAVDISDVASDYAERGWSQIRAWEEV